MKVILVVFNGDPMCFIHVLLNSLDMDHRGDGGRIVIEGAATALIPQVEDKGHFLHPLWEQVKEKDLIEGVCRACSNKMGTMTKAEKLGLKLLDDMKGHPCLASYLEKNYRIITF